MRILTLIILVLTSYSCSAQEHNKNLDFGVELDFLPYATGGHFGAAWVGKNNWRLRALNAYVKKPDWTTREGFSNHEIRAYAVLLDRFLKDDWKGWWVGAGVVYWSSSIKTTPQVLSSKFDNVLLNGSIGYNLTLYKKLYLSPWAGMSLRVAGDKDVPVAEKRYTLPLLNPEASLKVGYTF